MISSGSDAAEAPRAREDSHQGESGGRWVPLALVFASLLPHARAVWPDLTYYFRDFTVTFYPLRLFWARELREGRWPGWNPYVHEGIPVLPVLYPPDLLHALWPAPALVSWLLTLHFPLAALAAYLLARDLGLRRAGAFAAGAVFSLCGLCLSSLNLYVFLQALALAPLLALALRRAADRGEVWVPAAAALLALAVSTLAVEFVAQAVLLGAALGYADRPRPRAAARLALAIVTGIGLAAVPVFVTAGILRESVRGAGFVPEVALGNAVHPLALLQVVIPDLFGPLAAPAEAWWGGRFFSKGFPYLLSLYLGPLALALAVTGAASGSLARRRKAVLLVAGGCALWYALGAPAGLATAVSVLPGASWFRFPSKALLLPVLSIALLAGAGADALARGAAAWRRFTRACGVVALAPLAAAASMALAGDRLARWAAIPAALVPAAQRTIVAEGAQGALLALAGVIIAWLVSRARLAPLPALALVSTLLVADLARAGAGLNPQAPPAFFALLPELEGERLHALDGGRVFSHGLDQSPAFRSFLGRAGPGRGLWSFFLSRQMLVPYASVLDRVETAYGKDLTSFVPRGSDLEPDDFAPSRVGSIVDRLRASAVVRVLSLDPLSHPALRELSRVPAGPPQMWIHLFELGGAEPRAEVRCGSPGDAESTSHPSCRAGAVRAVRLHPAAREFDVRAAEAGYLLLRDTYARGWRAWVDGNESPVLREGGRHQAVALSAGPHRVRLAYAPPGLRAGVLVMAASLLAAVVLARKPLV